MRFENFGSFCLTLHYDVVCIPLQFDMASRYSNKRSERANGFVSETRNSQYHGLSEDCIEPSGGGTESGEAVSDSVFFGLREGAFGEKNLRDKSERISESELVPLAENPVHRASGDLSKTDQGDQPHQRGVFDFCPSRLKCGETVTVEKEIL